MLPEKVAGLTPAFRNAPSLLHRVETKPHRTVRITNRSAEIAIARPTNSKGEERRVETHGRKPAGHRRCILNHPGWSTRLHEQGLVVGKCLPSCLVQLPEIGASLLHKDSSTRALAWLCRIELSSHDRIGDSGQAIADRGVEQIENLVALCNPDKLHELQASRQGFVLLAIGCQLPKDAVGLRDTDASGQEQRSRVIRKQWQQGRTIRTIKLHGPRVFRAVNIARQREELICPCARTHVLDAHLYLTVGGRARDREWVPLPI
mmetsp:Transcript_11050/g.29458  ORF Transcript_11050/g.29458 Transcript_11050/m.29458 type:complete len:262 (+) Transcript_11050:148-933(+)